MAEVELKFDLPEAAQRAFRAHPALAGIAPSEKTLLAIYFDTEAEELLAHAMSLRLRRTGERWMQGLKAGRSGGGGLHAREEWEHPRDDFSIDLALFHDTPLARLPHPRRLHRRLAEIFRVDMRRTTWEVEMGPGSRVEVALDCGRVYRGAAFEPVSEVEVECLEGDPDAVFEFASRLIGKVALRPSALTKAGRGYRLLHGEARAPVVSKSAPLERGRTAAEAARHALAFALRQMQANEEAVLAGDVEALRQMRAALRRLRSTLRSYRPAIGPRLESELIEDLRWLGTLLGTARDWDVLATATLPAVEGQGELAGAARLEMWSAAERARAHARLRTALYSHRHARWILALARALSKPATASGARRSVRHLAGRALARRHRRLVAAADQLGAPGERHQLRLAAKRLRLVVEEFGALYPRRRMKAYREALSRVQDRLGEANDLAVAQRLLSQGARSGERRPWLAARSSRVLEGLERDLQRLLRAKTFWKGR